MTTKKYLDNLVGVPTLWAQIDEYFARTTEVPTAYTSNPAMDGTASPGSSTSWAKGDHVHPTDTSLAPKDHKSSSTTYGVGNSASYGHLKLSNAINSTSGVSDGIAATPKAVSDALADAKTYADTNDENTQYGTLSTSIGSASAGTAISADDITGWSAGYPPSFSLNQGVLSVSAGQAPSLTYTARSIPNITVTSTTVLTGLDPNDASQVEDLDAITTTSIRNICTL